MSFHNVMAGLFLIQAGLLVTFGLIVLYAAVRDRVMLWRRRREVDRLIADVRQRGRLRT